MVGERLIKYKTDEVDKKAVGRRIRRIRKRYKFKIKDFCKVLGVSRVTLLCWESGKTLPTPKNLKKLADMSNSSVVYLLEGSEDEQYLTEQNEVMTKYILMLEKENKELKERLRGNDSDKKSED